MNEKPGIQVRIIEDCRDRDGQNATGLVGVYEGDLPRTVTVVHRGDVHEFYYNAFVSGEIRFVDGRPVVDVLPREEEIYLPPRIHSDTFESYLEQLGRDGIAFWFVKLNPLIRLPDGSYIWGDQCWWEMLADDHSLGEAQQNLKGYKQVLRQIFREANQ